MSFKTEYGTTHSLLVIDALLLDTHYPYTTAPDCNAWVQG